MTIQAGASTVIPVADRTGHRPTNLPWITMNDMLEPELIQSFVGGIGIPLQAAAALNIGDAV